MKNCARAFCAVELDLVQFLINLVELLMVHPATNTVLSQFCFSAPYRAEDLCGPFTFVYRIRSNVGGELPRSRFQKKVFFSLVVLHNISENQAQLLFSP